MDRSIRNSNKNVFGAEASFHAWWWYFEFYNTINKIDDIRRWVIQRQVGPRIFRHKKKKIEGVQQSTIKKKGDATQK